MTKQLKDLFAAFSEMDNSQQMEKIREIRNHRSIERPAAAVKRVVKERKQRAKKVNTAADLLKKLTPEQRELLINQLKGSK